MDIMGSKKVNCLPITSGCLMFIIYLFINTICIDSRKWSHQVAVDKCDDIGNLDSKHVFVDSFYISKIIVISV